MCNRKHEDYHTTDLISDILSNGDSSRLYQKLIKEKSIFTSIDAFITGSYDNGLFVISGKLNKGISYEHAENELGELIDNIKTSQITERELQKVKNKAESKCIFSETDILNKSVNLAYYEFLGDADLVNQEICKYNSVKTDSILKVSNTIFKEENTTTLYYKSKEQN
jgi:zinc protease